MTTEARNLIESALHNLADAGLELRTRARAIHEHDPDVQAIEAIESVLERMIEDDEPDQEVTG